MPAQTGNGTHISATPIRFGVPGCRSLAAPPARQGPHRRERSDTLAKKNFGFEKRQKELNKKLKKEEKRLRKLERAANGEAPLEEDAAEETADGTTEPTV